MLISGGRTGAGVEWDSGVWASVWLPRSWTHFWSSYWLVLVSVAGTRQTVVKTNTLILSCGGTLRTLNIDNFFRCRRLETNGVRAWLKLLTTTALLVACYLLPMSWDSQDLLRRDQLVTDVTSKFVKNIFFIAFQANAQLFYMQKNSSSKYLKHSKSCGHETVLVMTEKLIVDERKPSQQTKSVERIRCGEV